MVGTPQTCSPGPHAFQTPPPNSRRWNDHRQHLAPIAGHTATSEADRRLFFIARTSALNAAVSLGHRRRFWIPEEGKPTQQENASAPEFGTNQVDRRPDGRPWVPLCKDEVLTGNKNSLFLGAQLAGFSYSSGGNGQCSAQNGSMCPSHSPTDRTQDRQRIVHCGLIAQSLSDGLATFG